VSVNSGERFPIKKGIPIFIESSAVTGENKKYQSLYDKIARGYDFSEKLVADLTWGGRDKVRRDILDSVTPNPNDKFLEVSIGTGINLRYMPEGVDFYGLDISSGMLAQCQRNLSKWKLQAELFQGIAEQLPFRDNTFDVVLHFGGINYFNDKPQAILEMIRVAKDGARIFIGDENEDYAKAAEKSWLPFARQFYGNRKEAISAPINLVPSTMLDIKVEQRWKGKFYMVSFVKPKGA
jgi:ubiquinone/menaquinone biosynthesis C-methylase UbiE